ncbi:MAG: adenylate/guanylate cyclase domain-containing protein [Mesorhizobium sp.]|nr:MAG: adenylate/guanylate cyclase domain-containing protein [Mesorhizobium sp.]RWP08242.1 MAG: adenylate/guanylate cyclase domain-containing protein [Mesorhizobium sp.]RWP24581.1 MAG: adenylate/guanylate cyclase domain-containing protein [Mesorhizobium sp.]RWP96814.1 MAG: adenylate/guanylate cyclase domain-containing protein [Mesorhizobium sp.]RWQ13242.1 MAG: adenylate/guanylate cyclase domain-containing protein [Mesorhizobium sp.]
MDRKLAAILAADVVGYSTLMERDEAGTFERLRAGRKDLFEPEIARHHGQIFKLMGDGMLAEFGSVVDAVECAVSLQRGLAERNAAVPEDQRIRVRIGINLGEVIVEGEDRYGEGVNVAARLQQLADPGGICVSAKVAREVERKLAFGFEPMGEQKVKNIAEPVQAFRVILEGQAPRQPARSSPPRWVWAGAAVLALILVLAGTTWRFWPSATVSDMPRIAVLPFDDMSAGADQGYLSDAVAEGIITELSRSKTYAVIARNSSFRYRDKPTDARQIGDELGVDYLLEGSQQKVGDRLKVTAQLLNAHDGSHLWANTYNREIGDLFVVQEEIIRTLADRVGQRIQRPLPKSDAAQVSALHYHLMGIAEIRKDFSAAGNALLRQFSLKAIKSDPNAQFGYIGLAWSYRNDAIFGWHEQEHDRDEALKRGAEYADKAILLAPDDAEAHHVRARIHTEAGEIEQALARFDQAMALNPSDPNILVGSTDPLLYIGRTDEAIDRIEQAKGIDPFHPDYFHWQMGWALWEKNDCGAALAAMRKMSRIPSGAHRMLAGIHACLGNEREAREALAVFLKDSPGQSISKERREWEKIWTAPGSLERWIEHMRFAGLPE